MSNYGTIQQEQRPLFNDEHDEPQVTHIAKPVTSTFEADIRNIFIAKVTTILACQLLFTIFVVSILTLIEPMHTYLLTHIWVMIVSGISSFVTIVIMWCFPCFLTLGSFTLSLSILLGSVIGFYNAMTILQAIIITTTMVIILTSIAVYSASKKKDLTKLSTFLFIGLNGLIVTTIIGVFLPFGSVARTIYSGIGAMVFSGYLVYDIWSIMTRYSPDEYIMASCCLFLDIINIFLNILTLLGLRK